MAKYPTYQMPLSDIHHFIQVSRKSGYRFEIILTGGEPLLWKDLGEGIDALRNSGICSKLHLFTNAGDIKRLPAEVAANVDTIRTSQYPENHKFFS